MVPSNKGREKKKPAPPRPKGLLQAELAGLKMRYELATADKTLRQCTECTYDEAVSICEKAISSIDTLFSRNNGRFLSADEFHSYSRAKERLDRWIDILVGLEGYRRDLDKQI
jgi:hypothetical protein